MIQKEIDHIGDTSKMVTAVDWLINELEEQNLIKLDKNKTVLFSKNFATRYELIIHEAKEMEKEQMGYTKEDVLMAGFIGEINHFDTKHIVSLLDEAKQYNETHGDK
jgi:hypothetical protein